MAVEEAEVTEEVAMEEVTMKVADVAIPVLTAVLAAVMALADGAVKLPVRIVVKEHLWSNTGVIDIVHEKTSYIDNVQFSFNLIM